jgi:hypothetical protein
LESFGKKIHGTNELNPCTLQAAQTFLVSAGSEVDRLQSSLKSSAESFKQLAAYINGAANAKMPDPQSFFTLLSSFANDLDVAHDDNCDVDAAVRWPDCSMHC